MATTKSYLTYLLEQLSGLDGLTYRMMMGEYILYLHGRIAAYVCDNRLLVKPVPSAFQLLPHAPMEPPYEGAKDMILVDQIDDCAFLKKLFEAMYPELQEPRKRKENRKNFHSCKEKD